MKKTWQTKGGVNFDLKLGVHFSNEGIAKRWPEVAQALQFHAAQYDLWPPMAKICELYVLWMLGYGFGIHFVVDILQ